MAATSLPKAQMPLGTVMDLSRSTASELVPQLRAGTLAVEDLARSCLDRIEQRERDIRAWRYLDPELILRQARVLDAASERGPLHGLPIGIKDVLHTLDMPTTHNSPIYADAKPTFDAACVAVLRSAGALIFGKTDTVEMAAAGRRAATRNPHDVARTPGGSSSGSAAAVADLHVPLAIGTQTGGSIIRPASFCGVYALKPTWGLVSTEGAKQYAASLDTIGWFARSVQDLALLHEIFAPRSREDIPAAKAKWRIAICRTSVWQEAEEDAQAILMRAAERLRGDAIVEELELPQPFETLVDAHKTIMIGEAPAAFLAELRGHYESLHDELRQQAQNAAGITRAQLLTAYDLVASCRATFDRLAGEYDAVLTLSAPGQAPVGLHYTGSYRFNALWTALHVPVVNLPRFSGADGLPVGLSLVGPRFSERRLLSTAAALDSMLATG
jgi:Asp-tRNA(Asn)/Glu-tRNA(Gln) amidotransferase A subunit family amidase